MQNEVELTVDKKTKEVNNIFSLELLKDAAVLVGLVSIIAYVLTYSYEKGFNSYFHIKNNFINDISISRVVDTLPTIGSLFLTLLLLLYFFNVLFPPDSESPFIRIFRQEYAYYNFMFIALIVINASNFGAVKIFLGVLLFINLLLTSAIFLSYKGTKGFKAKIIKHLEANPTQLSFLKKFQSFGFLKKLIFLVFIFGGLPNLSEIYGLSKAKAKEDFLIINQTTPLLVVKEFKDSLLVAPINISKAKVTPKYMIIEYKSSLKEPLELESIRFKDGVTVEKPVHYND